MSDFNLGTARGKIEIDSSGAEAGIGTAGRAVSGFSTGLDKASSSMLRTGAVMGGVGVAVAAGFGVALNSAANFEQRISAIGAVSDASSGDLDKFRKLALQLGQDTKFSAGEAASAIEELAKAGIAIPDILNGAARAVTNLAAAGEVDLARAAEITANAMNAFSISGQDAGRIADVFAVAANSSAADVDTLGQSLAQVSAVAHTVGLSFEDTISALELFANKGLQGSDAGTSLKTALLNLQPTTKEQIALFKELGLLTDQGGDKLLRLGGQALTAGDLVDHLGNASRSTIKELEKAGLTVDWTGKQFRDSQGHVLAWDQVQDIIVGKLGSSTSKMAELGLEVNKGGNAFFDAAGKLRPLVEIQAALQKATQGMTDAQKLATFETIGGSDAVRALSIIAGDTTGQLANLRGELTSQGQAQETAKKRMDNLKGSLEQLRGSVETALIKIGEVGQGPVRGIVDFLTKLVNAFVSMSPAAQQIVLLMVGLLGALVGLAGMFLLVGGGVLKVIKTFQELKAALAIIKEIQLVSRAMELLNLSFLANPIVLVIAALVALGIALVVAYNKSQAFRDVIDAIGRGIATAFGFILNIGGQVVSFFTNNWQLILAVLLPFVGIPLLIIQNWGTIVSFFAGLPGVIIGFISQFVSAVLSGFVDLVAAIPGFIGFLIGFIVGFFIRLVAEAVTFGFSFYQSIIDFISRIPGEFVSYLEEIFNFVVEWVPRVVSNAIDLGSRFLSAIVDWFSQLPGRVSGFLADVFNAVVSWVGDMVNRGTNGAADFFNAIVNGIQGLPGVVEGILGRVIDAFIGLIGRAWNAAKSFASGLWNGFKAGLGIGSPSLIEYAMWDLVDNVTQSTKDLRGQIVKIQKMSGLDFGGNVGFGVSMIPPNTLSTSSVQAANGSQVVSGSNTTFQNTFQTNADPTQISDQIMWDQRVRVR